MHMRPQGLIVLAALAVVVAVLPSPAQAQLSNLLPENTPQCMRDLFELPASNTAECLVAFLYIAEVASENTRDELRDFDPTTIEQNKLCDCMVRYTPQELVQVQTCLDSQLSGEELPAGFLNVFDVVTLKEECLAPCQPKMKKQKNCVDSLCPKNETAIFFPEYGKCQRQCKCLPRPPLPCPEETTQEACEEQCKDSFGRTKADRYLFGNFTLEDGGKCTNVCRCNPCPGKFKSDHAKCKKYCKKQDGAANGNGYFPKFKKGKKAFDVGEFTCDKVCTCLECPVAYTVASCTAECEGKGKVFRKTTTKKGCKKTNCLCDKA